MVRRRMGYLAMKTDPAADELINSDMNELKIAAKRLVNDASKLGGLAFGTAFLEWVASFAAILAGDACIVDSSSGGSSQFLFRHPKEQLGWCCDLSRYWLLPPARAYQGVWWIQKFLHASAWGIKHGGYYPFVGISSLDVDSGLRLGCSPQL